MGMQEPTENALMRGQSKDNAGITNKACCDCGGKKKRKG